MADALEAAKLKAEKAYNAAADAFDAEPLAFWDRYGRRTVERLKLRRGASVLDVCCRTGHFGEDTAVLHERDIRRPKSNSAS